MSVQYSRSLLRVIIAQLCRQLGWTAIHSSPLELLTNILERYIVQLGCQTHRFSELCMPAVMSTVVITSDLVLSVRPNNQLCNPRGQASARGSSRTNFYGLGLEGCINSFSVSPSNSRN